MAGRTYSSPWPAPNRPALDLGDGRPGNGCGDHAVIRCLYLPYDGHLDLLGTTKGRFPVKASPPRRVMRNPLVLRAPACRWERRRGRCKSVLTLPNRRYVWRTMSDPGQVREPGHAAGSAAAVDLYWIVGSRRARRADQRQALEADRPSLNGVLALISTIRLSWSLRQKVFRD